jgi:hypothetical protein
MLVTLRPPLCVAQWESSRISPKAWALQELDDRADALKDLRDLLGLPPRRCPRGRRASREQPQDSGRQRDR